jgi:tetratricopeptide (TPR) repeat protein
MIGLATFVDNNYSQGIKIWEGLELYVKNRLDLEVYLSKVKALKATAYILESRLLYFTGKIEQSMILRKKYLELTPNEYDKFLMEAINQIKVRNDAELALEFVKKAEKIAPRDEGTWRYSEFYLLIRLGRFEDALVSLDSILTCTFPNEIDTINQVISYNTTCLKEDQEHTQTYFILGVLIYKKLNLPIPAYEKLESFVINSKKDFGVLKARATQYLEEIDKIIGVKNV